MQARRPPAAKRNDRSPEVRKACCTRVVPENEVVESERIRGPSRAVRLCVKKCVGWQGWANAGMRCMSEIFCKTATSEVGGRPSTMQLSSLSSIFDAYREISAAECSSTAEAFKALCGSVPGYTAL